MSPLHAASFDCSKATTETEKAICDHIELGDLDLMLSRMWVEVEKTQPNIQKQRQWLGKRDLCLSDVLCLENSYLNRLSELIQNYSLTKKFELLDATSGEYESVYFVSQNLGTYTSYYYAFKLVDGHLVPLSLIKPISFEYIDTCDENNIETKEFDYSEVYSIPSTSSKGWEGSLESIDIYLKWVGHGDFSDITTYRLYGDRLAPVKALVDNCSDKRKKYVKAEFETGFLKKLHSQDKTFWKIEKMTSNENLDYSIIVWVLDKNRKPISSLWNQDLHPISYKISVYDENGELIDENQTLIGPIDDVNISLEYGVYFFEKDIFQVSVSYMETMGFSPSIDTYSSSFKVNDQEVKLLEYQFDGFEKNVRLFKKANLNFEEGVLSLNYKNGNVENMIALGETLAPNKKLSKKISAPNLPSISLNDVSIGALHNIIYTLEPLSDLGHFDFEPIEDLRASSLKTDNDSSKTYPKVDNSNFFAWLSKQIASNSELNTNDLIWDNEFLSFLSTNLPDGQLYYFGQTKKGEKETLNYHMINVLGGPPKQVKVIKKDQYFISGCRFRSCPEKGFVWMDSKNNYVIFGLLVYYVDEKEYHKDGILVLFSRDFDYLDETPIEFDETLTEWFDQVSVDPKEIRFID